MLPAAGNVLVSGSKSSALASVSNLGRVGSNPPVISTLPFRSSVAAWLMRGVIMLPVGVKVPIGCAEATLQNDRTRTDRNAANLLVIFVPQFLRVTKIWTEILSRKQYLANVFETRGQLKN